MGGEGPKFVMSSFDADSLLDKWGDFAHEARGIPPTKTKRNLD